MSRTDKPDRSFVEDDLARVVTAMDLSQLDNSCVLITGASGFMGIWLTELLAHLSRTRKMKLKLVLLASDFSFAKREAPHLYELNEGIEIICDDVRSIHELPADVEWIIHAAASPDLRVHNSQPIYASRTIAQGTLAVLECATRLPRLKKFVNVSSGYVYGYHSIKDLIGEKDFEGFDPSVFSTAYVEAKRYAESLCTIFRNQFRLPILNVRPFSFVGPYQSVDAPWAINNFISNVVNNQSIRIQGDGTAVRSYMYGADMAWWLLSMLIHGEPGCNYNLGSPDGITLGRLAEKVRKIAASDVSINLARAQVHSKKSIFVPSVDQVQSELALSIRFNLDEALTRTIHWNKRHEISH
jgi:dTDP-glucose 4,6-dehydratase